MVRLTIVKILFYGTVAAVCINNFFVTWFSLKPFMEKDKAVKDFVTYAHRYFSTWNFMLLSMYCVCGFICETVVLLYKCCHSRNYQLPQDIIEVARVWFNGVVWPCSTMGFITFWGLYAYDRELIYPEALDKYITSNSMHISNLYVILMPLIEIVLRPSFTPDKHMPFLYTTWRTACLFFAVHVYSYLELKFWVYPLLQMSYPTIYFPIILIAAMALLNACYYIQWPLAKLIHGTRQVPPVSRRDKRD